MGIGAPKETSLQNRSILGSIPRYIKSPPGGIGEWGVGIEQLAISNENRYNIKTAKNDQLQISSWRKFK